MSPLAFAGALLARWDRRVAAPRPLGLVFREPPRPGRPPRAPLPAPVLPRLRQSVRVDLRPAISLTVVRPPGARHTTSVHHKLSSSSTSDHASLERLVIRDGSALAAQRVVERVLSRSRRVELLAPGAPPSSTAELPLSQPPGLPPRLVVQRAVATTGDSRPPAHDGAPARPSTPPAPIPPALDLGRLTDQVMSAIDGRLIAQAERLGRG